MSKPRLFQQYEIDAAVKKCDEDTFDRARSKIRKLLVYNAEEEERIVGDDGEELLPERYTIFAGGALKNLHAHLMKLAENDGDFACLFKANKLDKRDYTDAERGQLASAVRSQIVYEALFAMHLQKEVECSRGEWFFRQKLKDRYEAHRRAKSKERKERATARTDQRRAAAMQRERTYVMKGGSYKAGRKALQAAYT